MLRPHSGSQERECVSSVQISFFLISKCLSGVQAAAWRGEVLWARHTVCARRAPEGPRGTQARARPPHEAQALSLVPGAGLCIPPRPLSPAPTASCGSLCMFSSLCCHHHESLEVEGSFCQHSYVPFGPLGLPGRFLLCLAPALLRLKGCKLVSSHLVSSPCSVRMCGLACLHGFF